LSQLFRGFSKAVSNHPAIDAEQFAAALQNGVEVAYKQISKPIEGTILTVSKGAAKQAVIASRRVSNMLELLEETVHGGYEALAKTPDMLPVLKQVGVVDAGGQGLMFIYDGFAAYLAGSPVASEGFTKSATATLFPSISHGSGLQPSHVHGASSPQAHGAKRVQSMLATEDIEFGYCTEFLLRVQPGKIEGLDFEENSFREMMSGYGDSLLIIADYNLVKVHIHAEFPGEVMNAAMQYGDLTGIKIENMREQHTHIISAAEPASGPNQANATPVKKYGFVAVSAGEGISAIFGSLNVDQVLFGGQTMNPSTESIAESVRKVPAEHVFILTNNSNIVMAAEQVQSIVADKRVYVIPTKTIPQGVAAAVAFQEGLEPEANVQKMKKAMSQVRSGQVTSAVRDTQLNGIDIKQGDYIGMADGAIVASESDMLQACKQLLETMIDADTEIVTIYAGMDAVPELTEELKEFIKRSCPAAELEVQEGGQPVYPYIFSAE
jgi:DAK2 domain fusion protein YloV